MNPASVSETELAVLKVLWDKERGTVRELQAVLREQGRNWAYTTVQTLLNRLEQKGFAASDKTNLAHVYRSVVSRDQMLQQRLIHLADELCEGTASPLVLALVEGARFTHQEIEQFRKLLDQLEASNPDKKGR